MSILTEMVRSTERRLSRVITAHSVADTRNRALDTPPPPDMIAALEGGDVAVIAEIKRRSPSQGAINPDLDVGRTATAYRHAGARAISVLTEPEYFGGDIDDLREAARAVDLPLLRKDFIISPYQVYEARAAGAAAVLLVVGAVYPAMLKSMLELTHQLRMCALVEVHSHAELDLALGTGARLIGINNRNLNTMEVSLETFGDLAPRVPSDRLLVSESGIRSRDDVEYVATMGADAVLVGTSVVGSAEPGGAVAELVGVSRRGRTRGREEEVTPQRIDATSGGWGLP